MPPYKNSGMPAEILTLAMLAQDGTGEASHIPSWCRRTF